MAKPSRGVGPTLPCGGRRLEAATVAEGVLVAAHLGELFGVPHVTEPILRVILPSPKPSPTAAMKEKDENPAEEPRGTSAEDVDVRVTLERMDQALDASAAEIERSKRLLRETEDLVDVPVSSQPGHSSGESEPS